MKYRHRNRDPDASALIGRFDISLQVLTSDEIFSRKFSILDARPVVARRQFDVIGHEQIDYSRQ